MVVNLSVDELIYVLILCVKDSVMVTSMMTIVLTSISSSMLLVTLASETMTRSDTSRTCCVFSLSLTSIAASV